MKKNDVIAVIIIILFVLLAGVSFGIWKLVSVVKKNMSVTSGSSASSSSSNDIVDAYGHGVSWGLLQTRHAMGRNGSHEVDWKW
ncbi:hypothetical protein EDB81DRAFT_939709 [Dactylonectria macrodidyma]|uniref:Uncharacterized protein n=1 Tax=Dactylonectria macrodidyma TaxID=307937 RepID=A0A9P9JME1_9HYPO|nr:hypothetical protein EDB81DRAFT_939709 [Dactylonectria macrodidyma]